MRHRFVLGRNRHNYYNTSLLNSNFGVYPLEELFWVWPRAT